MAGQYCMARGTSYRVENNQDGSESMPVAITVETGIGVVTLDNPPVNAISPWVPRAMIAALRAVAADPAVRAIVVRGAGRCFSAGADIAAFDLPRADAPTLRDLIAAIDAVEKPVVMAIHGLAYGGGLELALAGHLRVAMADARFALPELNLGLIPGAGGTQRLPRLIGIPNAMRMILDGRPVTAGDALEWGLIDAIAEGDLTEAAVARAHGASIRRVRDMPMPDVSAMAASVPAAAKKRPLLRPVVDAAIDAVRAGATLAFDAACARERATFEALLRTDVSRGMRHAFSAERAVGRMNGLPAVPDDIASAAIIGAGTMGTGIALALLGAGLPVTLIDPNDCSRARAAETIRKTLFDGAARGRMTQEQARTRLGLLEVKNSIDGAGAADIIIEAVFEDLDVKRQVFAAVDKIAKPGAVLASNTSTLDVDAIAAATSRPGSVVGTHFFSPANVMRLLEIVRGARTDASIVVRVLAFAKRIGKVGVVCGVCDGFIGNRMFEEYLRQAYWLLEQGALPEQLDGALERWGMALGPLRVMDLAGQDIGWSIRKRRAIEHPDRPYSVIPDRICEMGRFGQKTGAGFYLYPDGRRAVTDPRIDALVIAESARLGIVRREIDDAEIVESCVLALVNEGAKLLGEGIATRPLEIDQVYIHGYGFPPERGGPMFFADLLGVETVISRIEALSRGRNGWAWQTAPLLRDLAARGATLASLNGA
jgi:3-hydroxyacyl-CoA dehydrogenase